MPASRCGRDGGDTTLDLLVHVPRHIHCGDSELASPAIALKVEKNASNRWDVRARERIGEDFGSRKYTGRIVGKASQPKKWGMMRVLLEAEKMEFFLKKRFWGPFSNLLEMLHI
jgi:hypothetical protein